MIQPYIVTILSYIAGGFLGLWLAGGQSSLFWPPAGIGLAAIYLYGLLLLPAVWIGAFTVNWILYSGPLASAMIACGNTLEALVVGIVIRNILDSSGNLSAKTMEYVTIVVLACYLAAWNGFMVVSQTTPNLPISFHTTWWIGDMIGCCLAGALIIRITEWRNR